MADGKADPITERHEQASAYGVDIQKHEAFVEWVADNPEAATVEFRARGDSEAAANRTTATIGSYGLGDDEGGTNRDHQLRFGLPVELESEMGFLDPTERYEAVEGALAGLTACLNGTIVFNALREGIPVESVRTAVAVPTDLRVLFGIHDVDRAEDVFDEPEIEIEVTGKNLTDSDMDDLAEFPKRSPVYSLVTHAHPNDPTVTVRPTD